METKHVIITRGRGTWKEQKTLKLLLDAGIPAILAANTMNDVPPGHSDFLLADVEGITPKRNFVSDTFKDVKHIVYDDDLKFYIRVEGDKLPKTTPEQTLLMTKMLEEKLDEYPLVGVAGRFFCRMYDAPWGKNHNLARIFGINLRLHTEPYPRFDPAIGEDFDYNLQVISRGFDVPLLSAFAADDYGRKAGGCQLYRTGLKELLVYEYLQRKWPGIVSVGLLGEKRISWVNALKARNKK